jgi:cell shape-determining protein MreC
MNRFNSPRTGRTWPITARRAMLLGVLAVAIALGAMSNRLAPPLRAAWREALRPGLQVLSSADDWSSNFRDGLRSTAEQQLVDAQNKISDLTEQLRRRELQIQLARGDRASADNGVQLASTSSAVGDSVKNAADLPPLVNCQTVSARVLGKQAQSFLPPRDLLDVGQSQKITAKSLVIDDVKGGLDHPLLDRGRDADLKADRLVLAGRRVWGKVAEVGPHTSTVLRVGEAGYRDLVQLATERSGRLHFAARGVLVGTGDRLCKIELVETSEPVTIGDLVFTADDGVLDSPLLYGRVARVERKPGAPHWNIWMEPAVSIGRPPSSVAVLQMELNPARFAAGQ